MSAPFVPPTAEDLLALRALAERQLSPEEFEAYVRAPWAEGELEGTFALIDWFQRRYPTPLERLRYGRRAMRRARDRMPR